MADLRTTFGEVVGQKIRDWLVEQAAKKQLPTGTFSAGVTAPAIIRGEAEAAVPRIYEHAAQQRTPDYTAPVTEPVFGKPSAEETKQMVPQFSVRDQLPPMPDPGQAFPKFDRMRLIHDTNEEIAKQLAGSLSGNAMPFYSTNSMLLGLMDRAGLSPEQAAQFVRRWAGQIAATSPRTKTPQNARNAAYLLHREAQGDPLTTEKWLEERPFWMQQTEDSMGKGKGQVQQRPGFGMIGDMHPDLSTQFFTGTVDPWRNPKPFTFEQASSGNMSDIVADEHYISAVLDAADAVTPGGLPRQWFKNQAAYDNYVANKGFSRNAPNFEGPVHPDMSRSATALPDKALDTSLAGAKVQGRDAKTEYPLIQRPGYRAAEMLGISPSELQERLWFEQGNRTGLKSPPLTLSDLLNSQIEATARATGLHPEKILRLLATGSIPLAAAKQMNVPGESAVG